MIVLKGLVPFWAFFMWVVLIPFGMTLNNFIKKKGLVCSDWNYTTAHFWLFKKQACTFFSKYNVLPQLIAFVSGTSGRVTKIAYN